MTYFRKRLSAEVINRFNEKIIELARKDSLSQILRRKARKSRILTPKEPKSENAGTILMDATCAPADIKYPTDLNLVNDARELTENIIDLLLRQQQNPMHRPCTRLQIYCRRYLEITKHPECGVAKRCSALRFLLNAVRQNAEREIRLSGPKFGRPTKVVNSDILKQ